MARYEFKTNQARSRLMSKIKAKNTKPELKFRKALWAAGIRYRINDRSLPGCPDISVKKYKVAIFIDGEFWHGYNWLEKKKRIKANADYWISKIEKNILRDKTVNKELHELNYQVFRFWTREVDQHLGRCLKLILDYLNLIEDPIDDLLELQ